MASSCECKAVGLSVCLSVRLSVCLSVSVSVCVCVSFGRWVGVGLSSAILGLATGRGRDVKQ